MRKRLLRLTDNDQATVPSAISESRSRSRIARRNSRESAVAAQRGDPGIDARYLFSV
jgi:hypothetical protein